ncbi:hypothetical protein RRG08_012963 [Elysia crispata]|uniref:Uncharacterized protein n=1 Tax=Elysia crispata TaxID=231223 RepID=A0AAE1A070_9GAST|nr:hypothetical protein RRG08_012963 [Elysia crispata]
MFSWQLPVAKGLHSAETFVEHSPPPGRYDCRRPLNPLNLPSSFGASRTDYDCGDSFVPTPCYGYHSYPELSKPGRIKMVKRKDMLFTCNEGNKEFSRQSTRLANRDSISG